MTPSDLATMGYVALALAMILATVGSVLMIKNSGNVSEFLPRYVAGNISAILFVLFAIAFFLASTL